MTLKRLQAGWLALLAVISCGGPDSKDQAVPVGPVMVVTDGRWDEWGGAPILLADPADVPPESAVDIREIRALDDDRWLHLAVDVGRPVNAQRMRGTLRILFDADGEASTGAEVLGLEGVDAIAEISRRDKAGSDPFGSGVGVRPVTSGSGPGEIRSGYDVGLLTSPTWSASRLEIRLDRGTVLEGLPPLFTAETVRLKVAFEDAAGLRDETQAATYDLRTSYRSTRSNLLEPSVAKAQGVFRVVHWNVAGEAIRDRPERFLRILAALDPDVILFDEVYGSVTREDLERFFAQAPLGSLGGWRFVLGRGGGRQKNVVATLLPIRPEERLLEVAYPPGSLERLDEEAGDPDFSQLAELERVRGLATAGAWVEVDGREVLFVPLDLQSGGNDSSPRDRLRELQATTLRDRIAAVAATADGPAVAIVVGGDFNLVGSSRPLDVLRGGLGSGGRGGGGPELAVAEAFRLTDLSQATWRDLEEGDFTPGRLDFLLFSASALALDRAFIFDAGELSVAHLRRLGIEPEDSRRTSNHLPGVGDFRHSR